MFSAARHPAMISGRRGGKTVASCVKAFLYAHEHPGALICLTVNTYPAIRDIIVKTWYSLFGAGLGKMWDYKVADATITFPNGSNILLRASEDPDKLRGLTLAAFGMDEAAISNQHEAFQVLQATLSQVGYPHQGWVTTTPKGIRSWIYQRWVKNQLKDGAELDPEEYVLMQAHTRDNTYLTAEYMASLEASYGDTKWAQQELEGEFVAFEGQAFPEFDENVHVKSPPVGMKFKREVAGFDWGNVRPSAIIECQQDQTGRVWVTREWYKRRADLGEILNAMGDFPNRVYCDPTAKEEREFLQRSGVGARKARSNDFALRVSLVGRRLALVAGEPGLYISPDCPNLIEEIGSLTYAKQRGQDILNDKWEPGSDDHAFDALAYALMELDAGARGRPLPTIKLQWGH
ncbi:hypothetical protein LCGC14_0879480 [marine sediment metagenome]|uniref:Uncharacterized protein n=1 Tax=marine sediment metagenome TaxID=412755 RepID=A0A0F9RLU8_9ZZZZ